MNKFAAKVIGIALAVPMILGGTMVFADETEAETPEAVPGTQVYQEEIYVTGTLPGGVKYATGTTSFYAPVDGTYFFVTSDEDDNYLYEVRSVRPEFTIEGVTSNNPGDYWNCYSVIHLEAGEHQIDWLGHLPGFFTLTGSLMYADAVNVEAPVSEITETAPAVSAESIDARLASIKNFVGHLYTDGLGRQATEAEKTYWADLILCCSITGTDATSQILTSAEFDEHDFDNEQIAAILNDVFDTESEEDILAQLNGGASIESVIEQLAGTDEWASKCAFFGVNV